MSSTSERYEAAAQKFDEAYNKYAGEAGWNLATEQAKQQAEEQSGRAGAKAGVEANIAARTAGLSKGRAAMLGSNAEERQLLTVMAISIMLARQMH